MSKPFSRRSPQTEYTQRPQYYQTDDIAHVLAHVRFMGEFMDAIEQHDSLRPLYTEIYSVYMDLLGKSSVPMRWTSPSHSSPSKTRWSNAPTPSNNGFADVIR